MYEKSTNGQNRNKKEMLVQIDKTVYFMASYSIISIILITGYSLCCAPKDNMISDGQNSFI